MIAHGVHESGRREILSIDVGEAVPDRFLRGLVARGLVGVQPAISDAQAGLKAAIAKILGCSWPRCTVHCLRDCLGDARSRRQHPGTSACASCTASSGSSGATLLVASE